MLKTAPTAEPADVPAPEVSINALNIPLFCLRNGIGRTTFYRAVKEGHLRTVPLYGRRLVLLEDEAAFRQKLKAGELVLPPSRRKRPAEAGAA